MAVNAVSQFGILLSTKQIRNSNVQSLKTDT